MSWHKIWLVIRREYLFNFKRPSFLFTAFGVPLISIGAMFLIIQFTANRESNLNNFQQVGYIDRPQLVDPAAPNPQNYFEITNPDQEMPVQTGSGSNLGEYYNGLEQYATQQLLAGTLDAYFVINSDYVLTGRVDLYARKTIPVALRNDIESFMRGQIAQQAPTDLPVAITVLTEQDYTLRDVQSGKEMSDAALAGRLLLPFIFALIYFMATTTTAQFLMSGVVEEKENRLMEIFATSLRPQELLWGKLLGLGALALTQVTLWGIGGLVIGLFNKDARAFITGAKFQPTDIALIVVLFVINFLLFSATMLGIGASVTAEAESRQFAGLFTFAGVLPLMLLTLFFQDPNGAIPVILSFFPLTAAVSLTLRLGLTTLPTWQIALSVVVQAVAVLVVMWLAAKVFRLGMLMYGKPLTPRTLWQALREGRTTLTTATDYTAARKPARKRKGFLRR